jgi:hypothetical protein
MPDVARTMSSSGPVSPLWPIFRFSRNARVWNIHSWTFIPMWPSGFFGPRSTPATNPSSEMPM